MYNPHPPFEDMVKYGWDAAIFAVAAVAVWAILSNRLRSSDKIWRLTLLLLAALPAVHVMLDVFYWRRPLRMIDHAIPGLACLVISAVAIRGPRSGIIKNRR